jgi:hypothetical protein
MQTYNVFVQEMCIALIPANRGGGALAKKTYETKEAFVRDLQQYRGYTDSAIARFFDSADRDQTLLQHPLSDEAAAHLGWLPAFNAA